MYQLWFFVRLSKVFGFWEIWPCFGKFLYLKRRNNDRLLPYYFELLPHSGLLAMILPNLCCETHCCYEKLKNSITLCLKNNWPKREYVYVCKFCLINCGVNMWQCRMQRGNTHVDSSSIKMEKIYISVEKMQETWMNFCWWYSDFVSAPSSA